MSKRVLLISHACHPHWGSEAHVGWSNVCALSKDCDLTVLSSQDVLDPAHQEACEADPILSKVCFISLGQKHHYHPNRFVARIQSWFYFSKWIKEVESWCDQNARNGEYDLIHIVSYATWRVGYNLPTETPYIWGPLGGGDRIPFQFRSELSISAYLFEVVREVSNFLLLHVSKNKRCAQLARVVIPGNLGARDMLLRLGMKDNEGPIISSAFFEQSKIDKVRSIPREGYSPQGNLRIFSGGNLQGLKGVSMSLKALALLKKEGVTFTFTHGGGGSEKTRLTLMASQLGLSDSEIVFSDGFSGVEYIKHLRQCDVFMLPSLRDYAGLTMMDAMIAGCVPVVLRCGGPGEIVDNQCGFRIDPTSPKQVVEEMAHTLLRLANNPDLRREMGAQAQKRIISNYSEQRYRTRILEVYEMATARP